MRLQIGSVTLVFKIDRPSLFLQTALFFLLWLGVMPSLAPELPAITYPIMAAGGLLGVMASVAFRDAWVVAVDRAFRCPDVPVVLYPWGGTPEKTVPPAREARGLVVGTFASLLVAVLLLVGFAYVASPNIPVSIMAVLLALALFNILIAIAGLLPFYPLRCGRLIVASVHRNRGRDRAEMWMKVLCIGGSAGLLGLGVWQFMEGAAVAGIAVTVTAVFFASAGLIRARKESS